MFSGEGVPLICGIIVLVVTDILLWGSISYVHTIVGFNTFLVLSTGPSMISPLRIMIIILEGLLMLCQVHTDRIFRTFNRQGDVTFWRGGYVITDGGYPTCYGFMNPIVPSYDYHSVVWGEWVESVRKDVERLFGALKNRFVWLKSNILYHKVSTITAAVRVCSILHNRLLEYDNMIDFDWENIDPNTPDEELYERYVNSTVLLPEPSLVEDPLYIQHTFFHLNITKILDTSHQGIKISDRSVKRKEICACDCNI